MQSVVSHDSSLKAKAGESQVQDQLSLHMTTRRPCISNQKIILLEVVVHGLKFQHSGRLKQKNGESSISYLGRFPIKRKKWRAKKVSGREEKTKRRGR